MLILAFTNLFLGKLRMLDVPSLEPILTLLMDDHERVLYPLSKAGKQVGQELRDSLYGVDISLDDIEFNLKRKRVSALRMNVKPWLKACLGWFPSDFSAKEIQEGCR